MFKNKPVSLAAGKKAISDYFKASKDKAGQLELMVHYLESGNQFTVELGDINEQFYSSLESMFERIITVLQTQPTDVQVRYYSRLESVVSSARNIGWGYYDYISDLLGEFEINDTKYPSDTTDTAVFRISFNNSKFQHSLQQEMP